MADRMYLMKAHTSWTSEQTFLDLGYWNNPLDCEIAKLIVANLEDVQRKPKHICQVCQKEFTRRCHLVRHQRTHTGDKPFQCHVCDKKFTAKHSMTIHMRQHTGDKPFKCNVCGKLFTNSSGLKEHQRTHTGEKPFSCSHCGAKFRTSSPLKKHERLHTGYKFTYLTKHMRVHTGEPSAASNARSTMHIQTEEQLTLNTDAMEDPVEETVGGEHNIVDVDQFSAADFLTNTDISRICPSLIQTEELLTLNDDAMEDPVEEIVGGEHNVVNVDQFSAANFLKNTDISRICPSLSP